MASLIRDTTFGYLIRYVFGPKVLPHPDEVNLPEVWRHAVVRRGKSPTPDEKALSTSSPAGSEDHKDLSSTVPGGIVMQDGDATGGERGSDLMLVGWYGPDDEDNPQNWPRWKKIWVLFQTCLLTWAIYIGSSIYTAGLTDVQETFHVSEVAATLGLSLFVAGYAIGPMLWSPLSEVPQIGRLPIYIGTLLAFVLFQIPTALAKNFGTLLAFRFLSGFFGSPILATGGATIAEVFRPTHRAYGLVVWAMFATMGPVLGPLLGGFAATAEGWTWTAWELAWLSGFTLVLLFFFFPETSAANIIYRRARRLRHATGNDALRSQSELDVAGTTMRERALVILVRPFTLNFQEPIVLVLNIYSGLVYALLYIWFESFPIVFVGIYHFRPQLLGLSYLGILIGALAVAPTYLPYLKYVQGPMFSKEGFLKPEKRMPVAILGGCMIPVCLFWFGWTSRADVHWIVPIIGSSLFGYALLVVFNVIFNYLADAYPVYAASVLAGNNIVRSSFGAAFPLFVRAIYSRLGVGWATSLLAFFACAFVPIPVLLYYYGERIRLASKRARHDY